MRSSIHRGALALSLLVAGCPENASTTTDGGADRPTTTDLRVDVGSDLPVSPWQIEFRDGVTELDAIWGSGPNDIYAVGKNGNAAVIYHSMGDGNWVAQPTGSTQGFYAVWGSGPNDIYVGSFGNTLLHSTGDGTWTPQTIPNLGIRHIWGSSASDVYLLALGGAGNVYHSTGNGTWSALAIGSTSSTIAAAWGTSATNVYFAGGDDGPDYGTPYVVHGPSPPTVEIMPTFPDASRRDIFQIWGSGPNDIFAVGNNMNEILHSTGGGAWTLQTGPQGAPAGGTFEAIWGSGPNDIYVIGATTGLMHSTGDGVWTFDPDFRGTALAVWGTGPNDVYVVGDRIVHKKL